MSKTLLALPLILAACAGPQSQQLLLACGAHDAAIRALAPHAAVGALSRGQVAAADQSIATADSICSGEVQDFTTALDVIEAELLRLAIMGGE